MRKAQDKSSNAVAPDSLAADIAAFLGWLKARKYSPATVTSRRSAVERLHRFMATRGLARIQDVTVEVLGAFRQEMEARPFTQNSIEIYLSGVRQFFTYLETAGRLFTNPARETPIRRAPLPLPRVVALADVRRLLAAPDVSTPIGMRDRAMLETLYATGMRRAELLGLSLHDLDLDEQTVRVLGKGRKERVLPLGKHAAQALQRYLQHARPKFVARDGQVRDTLWLQRSGKPLSPFMVNIMLRKYARARGLPPGITTHALRRSCVTHMLANDAHPLYVARMLGHAEMRTLRHYLKVTIPDLKATHARSNPGR